MDAWDVNIQLSEGEAGKSFLFSLRSMTGADSGDSGGQKELGLQTYNLGIMPRTAYHPPAMLL